MESETSDNKQTRPWLFKKGQSGNPAGRPVGSTSLKTWAKEYLSSLTTEERLDFMEGMNKKDIWAMAEGNPETKTDITTAGKSLVPELSDEQYKRLILEGATRLTSEKSSQGTSN